MSSDDIIDELKMVIVGINNLRRERYDNKSNIKEKHESVKKRFFDINFRIFYTSCVIV